MSSRPFRLHRRTLLRGLATGLALPPLEAMMDGRGRFFTGPALGATTKPPVRFFCLIFANGCEKSLWNPKTEGAGFELPDVLQPLAALKGDLNVLSGLNMGYCNVPARGNEHRRGMEGALSGFPLINNPDKPGGRNESGASAPTLEWILGNALGKETRLPALSLSLPRGARNGRHEESSAQWVGKNQRAPTLQNPRELFDKLVPQMPGPTTGDPAAAARAARDKSILDYYFRDGERLSKRLGAGDRARLDEHLTSLRELERQIKFSPAASAASCGAPPITVTTSATAPSKQQPHDDVCMSQMAKLVGYAFRCDLTRYVTLDIHHANPETLDPYDNSDGSPNDHSISHNGPSAAMSYYTKKKTTYLAQVMSELKASKEGDRDVLFNSICTISSDVAVGRLHNFVDMPAIFGGNAGGPVKTGRHIRYNNVTWNNLLTSIVKYAGLPVEKFGIDATGPLTGLEG